MKVYLVHRFAYDGSGGTEGVYSTLELADAARNAGHEPQFTVIDVWDVDGRKIETVL